jgi:hypothetical protein
MLPKLHPYIAFSLLANSLIIAGLLPPAHAKSVETIESRNPVEKVALDSSVKTCANRALLQNDVAEIYSTQSNQGEEIPSAFTFNEIEVLNSSELDLDSILADEFDQKGILLADKLCCL